MKENATHFSGIKEESLSFLNTHAINLCLNTCLNFSDWLFRALLNMHRQKIKNLLGVDLQSHHNCSLSCNSSKQALSLTKENNSVCE